MRAITMAVGLAIAFSFLAPFAVAQDDGSLVPEADRHLETLFAIVGADSSEGWQGLLTAALHPSPNSTAALVLVRDLATSYVPASPETPALPEVDTSAAWSAIPPTPDVSGFSIDTAAAGVAGLAGSVVVLVPAGSSEPELAEQGFAVAAMLDDALSVVPALPPLEPVEASEAFVTDLGTIGGAEFPSATDLIHFLPDSLAGTEGSTPAGGEAAPLEPGFLPSAGDFGGASVLAVDGFDATLGRGSVQLAPVDFVGAPSAVMPVSPQVAGFETAIPLTPVDGPSAAAAAILLIAAFFPLYHRLQRRALLDHGVRRRLCELVAERPGIHIEELAKGAGCSRSTAVYHLRLLAKNGHLVAMGGRKSVHYFPNDGRHEPGEQARMALLTSPRTRTVAAVIVAQPGISRAELAAAAGVAVSTLSWHLGRLLGNGLVEERFGPTRNRGLYPGLGLAEMLRPWMEVPPAPEEILEVPAAEAFAPDTTWPPAA